MRPNLFIVGAPKCGTTAWVDYLGAHPSIYFAPVKEPHYFCTDFPGFRFCPDLAQYEELFAESRSALIRGEASVMYLFSRAAAKVIADYNPDARIIIFIRRQEEFLPSLHNQLLFNGDEVVENFAEAWRLSSNRVPPPSCREPRFLDYRSQGRFYEQVMRYVNAFGQEQVRIYDFGDWTCAPMLVYNDILEFLGVPRKDRASFPRINEAARHRIQMLGRFTQAPPPWAIKASSLIKRTTRRKDLPLIDWVRSLNRRKGYRTRGMTEDLAEEIRSCYAHDNRLLEPLIWRPET